MIEFIICDDDNKYLQMIKKVVADFMHTGNIEHSIKTYNDYNDEFIKVIEPTGNKRIYILDIETPSRSGIDVARMIRRKDFDSIIIFVTGHDQLGPIVLKRNIMCLAFVNKFDNLTKMLNIALEDALHFLRTNKILRINDNGVTYNIKMNSILYIVKDSPDRKIIVKTDNTEYRLGITLNEIRGLLSSKFVQSHRSCFVNENRIERINCKKKTITFDNGIEIDLLSDNYRKELKKC